MAVCKYKCRKCGKVFQREVYFGSRNLPQTCECGHSADKVEWKTEKIEKQKND